MQKPPSFFQRNWYFFTPIAIIAIPLLMAVYSAFNWGYGLSESMNALLHFGSSDTRYSVGFTEDHFQHVRVGMDGKTVYGWIKNPFERLDDDTRWNYSLPQGDAKYFHERTIILAKDAQGIPRVKQVISRFHTPETKP
jgi:hypothetical protein